MFFFLIPFILCSEYKLLRSIITTRHGHRTPVFVPTFGNAIWNCTLPSEISKTPISSLTFPEKNQRLFHKISYAPEDYGNCLKGQLTELGMLEHVKVGIFLRKRYLGEILSEYYSEKEIRIESSDVPRTIQSAESLIYGLYPEREDNEIFRIYVQDEDETDLYLNYYTSTTSCPKLKDLYKDMTDTSAWKEFQSSLLPLKEKLSKKLGCSAENVDLFALHDNLNVLYYGDLPFPYGLTFEDFNETEHAVCVQYYRYMYSNEEFLSLGIGHFIGRLLNRVEEVLKKQTEQQQPSIFLFSGHDTTIGPLTYALGIVDGSCKSLQWPKFASQVVLEVYLESSSNNLFVKVLYDLEEVKLPGCKDIYCSLEEFESITKKWIPSDWKKECQA